MAEVIYFATQQAFHDWLEQHPGAHELWVGYHKKGSAQSGITWSQSVDVALCFGWIDGIRKSVDDERYKIRFTPRKPGSIWSAVNVEKVKTLTQLGKMRPAGLRQFNSRADSKGYSAKDRDVPLPEDYEAQIRKNGAAWQFLNGLAPSYRRDSIWWVMSAKKDETRQRRLGVLIESCAAGMKIPHMRK